MTGEDTFEFSRSAGRWHKGAKPDEFQRIVSATHFYRPETRIRGSGRHCAAHRSRFWRSRQNGNFDCNGDGLCLGPPGRVFYVSENSVYVWVSELI